MVRTIFTMAACEGGLRVALGAMLSFTCLFSLREGVAEQADFQPAEAREEKPEPTPREKKVFSFGRFEPALREICREMEIDGRRTKLVQLSEIGRKGHADCPSCRAVWKSVYWACRDSAIVDTKAAPNPPKKKKKVTSEEQEGESAEVTPTPTPTPKPLQRYPSTALLDYTSRLSVALYNQDPGSGGYFKGLESFAGTVTSDSSLTPGERDYFSVFVTYLMASWKDRGEVPQAQEEGNDSKQIVDELFE